MLTVPPKGNYIREWRKYRGLSLVRLAARMEIEPGGEEFLSSVSIGRIEKGEQPLTMEIMQYIAHALECDPLDLLTVNPLMEAEVIDLLAVLRSLDKTKIELATRMLKAIA